MDLRLALSSPLLLHIDLLSTTVFPKLLEAAQIVYSCANMRICLVGWGSVPQSPGFGGQHDPTSIKAKSINVVTSVRMIMRRVYFPSSYFENDKLARLEA